MFIVPDIFVAPTRKIVRKKKKTLSETARRKNGALKAVENVDRDLTKKRAGRLSAFAALPSKTSFETQERDEPIVLFLRRHWITNVSWVLLALGLLAIPLILGFFPSNPLMDVLPPRFQVFIYILWFLLILSFVFEKFLGWFFNIYIITDERVIDVDFYSMIYKQVASAALDKIEDITYRTGGLSGSLFNFGNILIQTAGQQPNIEFESVPMPSKVVAILNELIAQEQQEILDGRIR